VACELIYKFKVENVLRGKTFKKVNQILLS